MKRAGRWLALGLLGTLGCGESTGGGEPATEGAGPAREEVTTDVRFDDVTTAAGVDFVHVTGGFGEKRLPETMGGGACLFDFDGDGVLDLFLVNGTAWPDAPAGSTQPGRCALYRGRGDGTFEDVSGSSGAGVEVYGMGCAAADYDADGDVDLFVTTLAEDLLLRNDGGRFTDVAGSAGVSGARWEDGSGARFPEWTTACLWLDADGDGWLDLFVGGYCEWTPEIEIYTTLDGTSKAFTTPDRYRGLPCRLHRNRGDGTFEELPFVDGDEPRPIGKALGAATWDLDGDGPLDVLVANDTRPDFLFENLGGGRFREIGASVGLAYDDNGRARAGMGIDVGILGKGGPVVVIGNFADEELTLRRRVRADLFRSEARTAGLARPTVAPLSFGLGLHDIDLDGHLDLVVANGHIEPDIARFRRGQTHAQAAQLFLGDGDGSFTDVSSAVGEDFARPRVGRALVAGDLDGDGDLDLVVTQNGGPPAVLLNRVQERAPRHYLRVELAGTAPNRAALGARVVLTAGGNTQERIVRTGSSYLGHGETTLTFGLGSLARVERLEVRWPGGRRQLVPVDGVDRVLRVEEGAGEPR